VGAVPEKLKAILLMKREPDLRRALEEIMPTISQMIHKMNGTQSEEFDVPLRCFLCEYPLIQDRCPMCEHGPRSVIKKSVWRAMGGGYF
jgi:hypothetical protein